MNFPAGSPPRMRGQGDLESCIIHTPGITPADAGTRRRGDPMERSNGDHPRGCGDKLILLRNFAAGFGSPPRMRGQDVSAILDELGEWITPADAGTRSFASQCSEAGEDHPRGCGDKTITFLFQSSGMGSPPRMRGQDPNMKRVFAYLRITPADAGTSNSCHSSASDGEDHPRGCGDKAGLKPINAETVGSPPRMRGQVGNRRNKDVPLRITPADAGTSHRRIYAHRFPRDHPRGCGDK